MNNKIATLIRSTRREWRKIFMSKNVFVCDENERSNTCRIISEFEDVEEALLP